MALFRPSFPWGGYSGEAGPRSELSTRALRSSLPRALVSQAGSAYMGRLAGQPTRARTERVGVARETTWHGYHNYGVTTLTPHNHMCKVITKSIDATKTLQQHEPTTRTLSRQQFSNNNYSMLVKSS